jgi:hypothetical protein
VGFGVVDLDPVIFNKYTNMQQKCYLAFKRQTAGFVNLKISFTEQYLGILIFRIMTASIRRKTSTLSDMKCVARITIGEDIEQTEVSKDTKETPPSWNGTFKISIVDRKMNGKLAILDMGVGG